MILNSMTRTICVLALGAASMTVTTGALADEWPLVPGLYWEVTTIHIKDGGDLKYATWLASEWKKNLEFSKSKGWIKDYKIFSNEFARPGEPDLYLVRIVDSVVSGAESEKRQAEYMEWQKKSLAQMDAESGNRSEYREVMGSSLLQELTFRK
jgi:hypothetical protein